MCVYTSQELNGRAEGKFSRLKTQAKTKIRELTAQLERLREEQGASPQLNLSATQVESSFVSSPSSLCVNDLPCLLCMC